MYPKPIKDFITQFASLPSIGPRQASRLAFHLLKKPASEIQELAKVILALHENMNICGTCFNVSENADKTCRTCSDSSRNQNIICVIEKENDAAAIEKTGRFNGLYHILGGTISKIDPDSHKHLHINELFKRIKTSQTTANPVKEVIIALNPTPEGDMTAMYLERTLKANEIKITRLGRGLPNGADVEFADEDTLGEAIDARKEIK